MLLTDLITEKHLKFLGDVKCKKGDMVTFLLRDSDGWYFQQIDDFPSRFNLDLNVAATEWFASCVLEHAVRVKLDNLGVDICTDHLHPVSCFWYELPTEGGEDTYETREEALIAAMDALIGGEAQAPKTTE